MRSDIIKVYKDVHIWVGILSGLALFVAFYAGAITMFEKPLERWATPPDQLPAPIALERAPELIAATLAMHPEAAASYQIRTTVTPDQPGRLVWQIRGERRGEQTEYAAALDADGHLQVVQTYKSQVAELVDVLHQQVGLPFEHEVAMPIMGVIALLYAVALISGVIVLLPTLIKDLFALRIGKNLKRLWLDVHNALGIFSLPFHIVMALTAVVFAFHDQFYDVQEAVVYPQKIEWAADPPEPRPADAQVLPPHVLIERVNAQAPHFQVLAVGYSERKGQLTARVEGLDPRYGMRGRISTQVGVNPYTGQLHRDDLPGELPGWETAVASFFSLHFGNFGGNGIRWAYFLLGLGGAVLFYTGNVLWLESRRSKQRHHETLSQSRSSRILASLTVGVSFGCIAGISATIAAAKWLPAWLDAAAAEQWHSGIYYTVFLAAVAWSLLRGGARAASEVPLAAAIACVLIPLSSVAGIRRWGGAWPSTGSAIWVDVIAMIGAVLLVWIARRARDRGLNGPRDSVWSFAARASAG